MTAVTGHWSSADAMTAGKLNGTLVLQNVFASRPASDTALAGKVFYATDTHALYVQTSAGWEEIMPGDAAAGVKSKRSLGTSATQAASGQHASTHQPSGGDAMAVDAAVGTGSLRTLGTGATQGAVGSHVHSIIADANAEDSDRHNAAAISGPAIDQDLSVSTSYVQTLSTTTITVANKSRLITVGSAFCRSSIGSTVDLELLVDGNIRDTAAVPTTSGLTSMILHAEETFATGKSLTVLIRAKNNHGSSTPDFQFGNSALAARSVKI
jgi:hypothetical protein